MIGRVWQKELPEIPLTSTAEGQLDLFVQPRLLQWKASYALKEKHGALRKGKWTKSIQKMKNDYYIKLVVKKYFLNIKKSIM